MVDYDPRCLHVHWRLWDNIYVTSYRGDLSFVYVTKTAVNIMKSNGANVFGRTATSTAYTRAPPLGTTRGKQRRPLSRWSPRRGRCIACYAIAHCCPIRE